MGAVCGSLIGKGRGRWVFLLCLAVIPPAPWEEPPVVTPTQLRHRLERQGDTLVVVNFWATWCRPCIEELPLFDSLAHRYRHAPVRVWLVNVDERSRWERSVKPFIRRRQFSLPVLLLAHGGGSQWMGTLHPAWTGTIPATLFWRASDSVAELVEGEWTAEELERYVQQYVRYR